MNPHEILNTAPDKLYLGTCWFCGKEIYGVVLITLNGKTECINHWEKTIDIEAKNDRAQSPQ